VFDDLDHELQLSLVDAAIVESTTGHRQYQRLIAAYLDQNLPALASEISETGLSEPDCHVFREALLTNRNARFCERILAALPEHQKIFVAVGAAHLLGPDGLLDLFRQQDFEIIPVPFQFAVPGQLRQLTLPLVPQNQ